MTDEFEEKLKAFLEFFWLRPENGLAVACMSHALSNITFQSPSLDIGCGDGIFSFYNQGGRLEKTSDMFSLTNASKFKHDSGIDIYDVDNDEYFVNIKKHPNYKMDYGTDWKQKLLNKAAKLDFYENLVLHDSNKPFPFEDNKFKTIFSDTVNWVKTENIPKLLSEIHRMLRPEGTAALFFFTKHHVETLEKLESILDSKAIDILDRDRRKSMNCIWDYSDWREQVINAGFKIEKVVNTYPNKYIMDIWNIGLRPIGHLLIQMSQDIPVEKKIRIKDEWVETFFEIFKSLIKIENLPIEKQGYPLFILKKTTRD